MCPFITNQVIVPGELPRVYVFVFIGFPNCKYLSGTAGNGSFIWSISLASTDPFLNNLIH
jgi:hypothetical protein